MSERQSFAQVIIRLAQSRPCEVFVSSDHEGTRLCAGELHVASTGLAWEYRARGVTRNNLVTVALANGLEFVAACPVVRKAMITIADLLSPDLPEAEHAQQLESLAPRALAIARPLVNPQIPWLHEEFSFCDNADALADHWKAPVTSGSTGPPKIVIAAAFALINPEYPVAQCLPQGAIQLMTAPQWHSAQFGDAIRGLLSAHRLVLTDQFDEQRFFDLVERYCISWMLLSRSGIHRLVQVHSSGGVASLRTALRLGASCAPDGKHALIDWLGAERVVKFYVESEPNGLTMMTDDERLSEPSSVGKLIGGTEVRLPGADGPLAPVAAIGHIWMRRGQAPFHALPGCALTLYQRRLGHAERRWICRGCWLSVRRRRCHRPQRYRGSSITGRAQPCTPPCVRDAVVYSADRGEVFAIVDKSSVRSWRPARCRRKSLSHALGYEIAQARFDAAPSSQMRPATMHI